MAMSLKAAVGPSDRCAILTPGSRSVTGTICAEANFGVEYARAVMPLRSSTGMSSMNSETTSAASAA